MSHNQIIDLIRDTNFGKSLKVFDNLVLFRLPKVHFREGQSYAVLQEDGMILIDVVHEQTKGAVEELMKQHKPKALILTHKDLLHQSFDNMKVVSDWLGGIPVFVHPADHERQHLEDITESNHMLNEAGILTTPISGHTKGSVVLYFTREEMLFAGDSAVGAPYNSEEEGFTHPTIPLGRWLDFKQGWNNVAGEIKHLLPLHGKPGFFLENFKEIRQKLITPENLMK